MLDPFLIGAKLFIFWQIQPSTKILELRIVAASFSQEKNKISITFLSIIEDGKKSSFFRKKVKSDEFIIVDLIGAFVVDIANKNYTGIKSKSIIPSAAMLVFEDLIAIKQGLNSDLHLIN